MNKKTILVTGGAGFIGSNVNEMLYNAGYETVVYDNLSKGNANAVLHGTFVKGDLEDEKALNELFKKYQFDAVMHFAAYTDVGESVSDPALYFKNNVVNSINLLEVMRKNGVKNFIFSSSAAVYGNPLTDKITEEHPCHPINPYGETKRIVEKILKSYEKAYGFKYCSLRYFNAAGGDPNAQIKNYKKKENNLIPLALKSLKDNGTLTIFGTDYPTKDGTCVRDYIHVYDLGNAHILAMENLLKGGESEIYNLGNGNGFTIREVIDATEKVTGQKLKVKEGHRRPGDPPVLVADTTKAHKKLGWKPKYSTLEMMIDHAWKALA